MLKKVLLAAFVITLASCKGGNKGPVMATKEDSTIDYNQNATEHKAKVSTEKQDIELSRVEGTMSIADVIKNRKELAGKTISVTGKVTKYNPAIMNLNWVHIQDGTEYSKEFDLTITTVDAVNEGDQVVFTGILAIDRDFGYGYKYKLILEEAVLKK